MMIRMLFSLLTRVYTIHYADPDRFDSVTTDRTAGRAMTHFWRQTTTSTMSMLVAILVLAGIAGMEVSSNVWGGVASE